ncbi:unnamed protein product [Microthlaspi erraticum]|uniref:CCHC-type domain-containing protein n=1 Tax=Microthlaspi erraticum TaxID=1685480 RepID=A0A6D2JKC2_9BRAS|nr:unnamed protein product [Microthlaspi erraticum]
MQSSMHTSRASLVELAASIEADLEWASWSVAMPSPPATQPRSQQQQQQQRRGGSSFSSGSGRGGLPAQGQKRSREEFSGASQFPRGSCFGCGSTEHRVSSCPKRESAPRVCYYCKEPGHIKPMCPKLQSMSVASVQPVAAQPVSQIAAVQPLGQIAPAPRGLLFSGDWRDESDRADHSFVEVLNAIECVGTLLVGGFESHVLFDSGASNCFITPERAEKSGIRSSGRERGHGQGFLSKKWLYREPRPSRASGRPRNECSVVGQNQIRPSKVSAKVQPRPSTHHDPGSNVPRSAKPQPLKPCRARPCARSGKQRLAAARPIAYHGRWRRPSRESHVPHVEKHRPMLHPSDHSADRESATTVRSFRPRPRPDIRPIVPTDRPNAAVDPKPVLKPVSRIFTARLNPKPPLKT